MSKYKILSGEELVEKGETKHRATLPEIGVKDIIPNGSWLEQKQIQAAVEARKHLIEVERIEKCGVLSQAVWNEELGLAEVTQQVGGHWQYLGHHVDKQLYLNPEEALYLMEVNCLQLKYNEVTVSMQQAYSLLLRGEITLSQYKVYASLSRLGYKLFRHQKVETKKKSDMDIESNAATENCNNKDEDVNLSLHNEINSEDNTVLNESTDKGPEEKDLCDTPIIDLKAVDVNHGDIVNAEIKPVLKSWKETITQRLMTRQSETISITKKEKCFEAVPDMCQKSIVTVNVPEETHLPRNIFLNNTSYVINLDNLNKKALTIKSAYNRTYNITDEVNDSHVRRIRNNSRNDSPYHSSWANANFPHIRFQRFNQPFFWSFGTRPRQFNNFLYNFMFQRSFVTQNFTPRFQSYPRHQMSFLGRYRQPWNNNEGSGQNYNIYQRENRKRSRDSEKRAHFEAIKQLSVRLKQLIMNGVTQTENVQSLQSIINNYNIRYKTKLRLNADLDIISDENIIETIDLADDELNNKRSRQSEYNSSYKENFKNAQKLALRLKELDAKGEANAKHRRCFSNMIKNFNKSYNADIFLDKNFEIIDRRHIVLDSSESDCVIEDDPPRSAKKSKKVKNPFSILKQNSLMQPTSSTEIENADDADYAELSKIFSEHWLPKPNDFGRPEVLSKEYGSHWLANARKEEFIFQFIKDYGNTFRNWIDVKLAFWESIEDDPIINQEEAIMDSDACLHSLVNPEDVKDMATVLQKLQVIKSCKERGVVTSLVIHFDVFNRNVQNFRKSNRPTPHFRIICIEESSSLPSGMDVQTIYSKYQDDVPIVFAIVGVASISYLQMKPTDLPLYLPSSDLS